MVQAIIFIIQLLINATYVPCLKNIYLNFEEKTIQAKRLTKKRRKSAEQKRGLSYSDRQAQF